MKGKFLINDSVIAITFGHNCDFKIPSSTFVKFLVDVVYLNKTDDNWLLCLRVCAQ